MKYDEYGPEQIKHMEMVQAVVARLGTDSFLVKGWAVAFTSALLGFGINGDDWRLAGLAVVPGLALWGLDAYFLRAERLFRALFDAIRTGSPAVEPFAMAATSSKFVQALLKTKPGAAVSWHAVVFSRTLCVFYSLLAGTSAAIAVALGC